MMVPDRLDPVSELPRNDTEPALNEILVDGSHGPDVAASVSERFAKKVSLDDPAVKARLAGPERPSVHSWEKSVEHATVCG